MVTNVCPRRTIPDDTWQWLSAFSHFRAGNLWSAGGVSDQPNIYLDAMQLIQTWSDKLKPP